MHRPYIERVYADFYGARTDLTYSFNEMDQFINGNNCTTPFARAAIGGPDQLRQRVAFALSQLFVISDVSLGDDSQTEPLTAYYDILGNGAFGNFRKLLEDVTLNPMMGL